MKRLMMGIILAALLLSGCTTPTGGNRAQQQVDAFHQAWQANDFDTMLNFYDSAFLAAKGRKSWAQKLRQYQKKLGTLLQASKISSQLDARFSGDFYIYRYRLRFEKGQLRETLTLYQQLNQKNLLIVGHMLER